MSPLILGAGAGIGSSYLTVFSYDLSEAEELRCSVGYELRQLEGGAPFSPKRVESAAKL